jgi:glutathione reductase (NADPH)
VAISPWSSRASSTAWAADAHLVYRGELFLRGFDREVREFTRDQMAAKGVNLHFETNIERIDQGERACW